MDIGNLALALAGLIGTGVALVHGVLTQKLVVSPLEQMAAQNGKLHLSVQRLVPALMHFSTFVWLFGGLILIAIASGWAAESRLLICLLVGGVYLYGAIGNFWATRGRHPGWILLAFSVTLIAFSIVAEGS